MSAGRRWSSSILSRTGPRLSLQSNWSARCGQGHVHESARIHRGRHRRPCAGRSGCAGAIAYGVAKGAIPQFARSLARELAEYNIRVNAVSPGVIRTLFQDYLTPEQVLDNAENRIPLRRDGKSEDVAAAIVMLVENDFIAGETVTIDGGMTMRIA